MYEQRRIRDGGMVPREYSMRRLFVEISGFFRRVPGIRRARDRGGFSGLLYWGAGLVGAERQGREG